MDKLGHVGKVFTFRVIDVRILDAKAQIAKKDSRRLDLNSGCIASGFTDTFSQWAQDAGFRLTTCRNDAGENRTLFIRHASHVARM